MFKLMRLAVFSPFQNCFHDGILLSTVKTGSKRQNFRLVQIESFFRRQNKCDLKTDFFSERTENILGKGENAGYSFALYVFKSLLLGGWGGGGKVFH